MRGKGKSRLLAIALLMSGSWITAAYAAAPWGKLFSSNGVEADPKKSYDLSDENGPWMILATTFSGEGAEKQAKDLVLELRKRYKLPAYVYKKHIDFGKAEGHGVDKYGNPVKMTYMRGRDQLDEIAVMVGNYRTVDEPEAQEVLKTLKFSTPDCLEVKDDRRTTQTLAAWRKIQQVVLAEGSKNKKMGPMRHAFMTPNPVLPKEYFATKGVDKLVLKMNEGVDHCLLDCPGKYTVQVAHFTGKVVLDQNEIRKITAGAKGIDSQLADAAEKAHYLTRALRKAGFEAYEFHDHMASIVTVGNFESVGTPRADGKTEINPAVFEIMKRFGSAYDNGSATDAKSGAIVAKVWKLEDGTKVSLDPNPIPVEVPRRSIAADYRRDVVR